MRIKPFDSLPGGDVIFRIAEVGKSYLPKGEKLPTAGFFEPSSDDKKEAEARGRIPGLSVWNYRYSTPRDAVKIRFSSDMPSEKVLRVYNLECGKIRKIGSENGVLLDIVSDPLPEKQGPGASGHSLIEGLARKAGGSRLVYKRLRLRIAQACEENKCFEEGRVRY